MSQPAASDPSRARLSIGFINLAHALDHYVILIFPTVVIGLQAVYGRSYAELIALGTASFVAFGVFSLPAGWLADRWSRYGMMSVLLIGIGLASLFTSVASTPFQIMILLFFVGVLAAIYHPVGLAMVVESAKATGTGQAIAINGVWGNLGVGSAALITGFLIDTAGWRAAFILPGLISIAIGVAYFIFSRPEMAAEQAAKAAKRAAGNPGAAKPAAGASTAGDQRLRQLLLRLTIIIFCTAALSSIVFQSTTFALPTIAEAAEAPNHPAGAASSGQ